jgi:hypothetical protein
LIANSPNGGQQLVEISTAGKMLSTGSYEKVKKKVAGAQGVKKARRSGGIIIHKSFIFNV